MGGYWDGDYHRGMEGEEYRRRPTEEQRQGMNDDQARELEIDGLYLDNDDIKNVAEDIQDTWNDFSKLMDQKNPLMAKAIELDAKIRFSPAVQEMKKMIFEDFGIKSVRDLENAAE